MACRAAGRNCTPSNLEDDPLVFLPSSSSFEPFDAAELLRLLRRLPRRRVCHMGDSVEMQVFNGLAARLMAHAHEAVHVVKLPLERPLLGGDGGEDVDVDDDALLARLSAAQRANTSTTGVWDDEALLELLQARSADAITMAFFVYRGESAAGLPNATEVDHRKVREQRGCFYGIDSTPRLCKVCEHCAHACVCVCSHELHRSELGRSWAAAS